MRKTRSLIILLSVLLVNGLFGEDLESQLDNMYLNGGDQKELESGPKWDFYGYLENENYLGLNPSNSAPDHDLIKLELRSRLNAKYGTEFYFAKAVLDLYFYPVNALNNVNQAGAIDPYEFYFQAGKSLQVKAGKIVHNWGSADAFRITNYLDQRDLRELFMKEEDERYRGSYSFEVKYLFGDFAIEGSIVPGLNPVLFPVSGSYWQIMPSSVNSIQPVFHSDMTNLDYKNISAAIRGGGTTGIFDFHLSYFYGTNSSIVMVPEVTASMITGQPLKVDLYPDYSKVHKIGFDGAINIEKLAARLEGVYTFNQNALLKDSTDTTLVSTDAANKTVTAKRNLGSVPYLAFTAGVDYNLWGTNGRVLVEYTNSFYLKDTNLYEEEFFTNFLLITLSDKFFNEHLEVKFTGITRPQNNPGLMTGLSAAYDFQNGMVLTVGGLYFYGGDDSMLSLYQNSDLAYFRFRMNF